MLNRTGELKSRVAEVLFVVCSLMMVCAVPASGCALLEWGTPDGRETGSSSEVRSLASDEASSDANSASQTEPAAGVGPSSKFHIHGFLTQAWADAKFVELPTVTLPDGSPLVLSTSPSVAEISLGIPEAGTTDYRFLALQFRYDITPKDTFVVQFSSRELGFSSIQNEEDEVEIDWAFYERQLGDRASFKVGRVQIPYGIYNEYRDVGVILPFYRPPYNIYKEGSFTSETVDGAALSYTFFGDSDWALDASIYTGEWEAVQLAFNDPSNAGIVKAKKGYGYQFWLNTPVSDLRFGTGLLSFRQEGGPFLIDGRRDLFLFSVDMTLGNFTFQSEWQYEDTDLIIPQAPNQSTKTTDSYVLLGYRITPKVAIWAQWDNDEFELTWANFLTEPLKPKGREDYGISFHYLFSSNLLLKAEYHEVEEDKWELLPTPPFGVPFRPIVATATGGNYTILSLSVSF